VTDTFKLLPQKLFLS